MKITHVTLITVILCMLVMNTTIFAGETTLWVKDDPSIEIYDEGTVSDDYHTVQVLNNDGQYITADLIVPGTPIRLLMINGGFVLGAKIVVENDRTLVPVRIISEILDAKVDWDGNSRAVTITDANTSIILKIDSSQANINNQTIALDAPAKIISDKTYVPLRFIAEALNAKVGYTDKFNDTPNSLLLNYHISIVTIERTKDNPKYTVNDGLAAVKAASADAYKSTVDYLKETGRTFSEPNNPDYNSQDITYVTNFGRYFVYRLTSFESFNILYNSYTGEIFSQQPGLPFLFIGKGFTNIGWMYQ